jgi:uncharacterized protein YciI
MLFALVCTDKPGAAELRSSNRPKHLAFLERHADQLVYAGPLIGEDGQTPAGSLIILDAPDQRAAECFAEQDPYAEAGVFQSVTIRPTKRVYPQING